MYLEVNAFEDQEIMVVYISDDEKWIRFETTKEYYAPNKFIEALNLVGKMSGFFPYYMTAMQLNDPSWLADFLPCMDTIVNNPVNKSPKPLKYVVIELNDKHKWTREQVADWLETLDLDLEFKIPEKIETDPPVLEWNYYVKPHG